MACATPTRLLPPQDDPDDPGSDGSEGDESVVGDTTPPPRSRQPPPAAALAGAAVAAVAALLAARTARRRARPRPPSRATLDACIDPAGAVGEAGGGGGGLAGTTCVYSPLLRSEAYGRGRSPSPARAPRAPRASLDAARAPHAVAAPAVAALAAAGAAVLGFATDDELATGPLSPTPDADGATLNPAWPSGAALAGPGARAAAAVAGGAADLALGLDGGGGLASQAAAQGLACLRATAGAGPAGPAPPPGAGPLAALAVAARGLHTVAAAAAALGLPGAPPPGARPPPSQVIVATDLFEGCAGPGAAALAAAAQRAAARWAPGMVSSGLVSSYLKEKVPTAASLLDEDEARAGAVLRGMRRASETLRGVSLLEAHGRRLLAAAHAAARAAPPGAAAVGDGASSLTAAAAVWKEAAAALKGVLAPDWTIFVVPALPGPPPSPGASPADRDRWAQGARGLACVAALGGVPSVVVPVARPRGARAGPPAAVLLIGGAGTDCALLDVAMRFEPLLVEEYSAALASGSTNPARAAAPRNRRAAAPPSPRATAAALREEGNAAFRAGDFEAAAARYTEAAAADPTCALAPSNRAAAHLKLLRYDAAEADASASLKLAISAKALLRRGMARAGLGDAGGALDDYKRVLAMEPSNRQVRLELEALAAVAGVAGLQNTGGAAADGAGSAFV